MLNTIVLLVCGFHNMSWLVKIYTHTLYIMYIMIYKKEMQVQPVPDKKSITWQSNELH